MLRLLENRSTPAQSSHRADTVWCFKSWFPGLLIATIILGVAGETTAQSITRCDSRVVILDHLRTKYSEIPVSIGLTFHGWAFEITANAISGTWSLVLTPQGKQTCIVNHGTNYYQRNIGSF